MNTQKLILVYHLIMMKPTDKPMMKTLLQLRNMGLIEVEWEPGDDRYT